MSLSKPSLHRALAGRTFLAGDTTARRVPAALLTASVWLMSSQCAQAQTWTGASDSRYANALNWAPSTIPNAAGAMAIFVDGVPTLSVNLDQAIGISTLSFSAATSAYTINLLGPAGFLTVGGTGIINSDPDVIQTVRIGSGANLLLNGSAMIQDTTIQVDPLGTFTLSGAASGGNARMIVNGTTVVSPGMGDVEFGSLEGSGSVQIGSGSNFVTDTDTNTTFSGSFSGGGSLEVDGSGTLTVTGNSSLGGDITTCCANLVIKGNFNILGDAIVQGGSLTVSTGGHLNAAGAAGIMFGDLTVEGGGTLDASAFGSVTGGNFTVTGPGSRATSGVASFLAILDPGRVIVSNGGRLETAGDAEIGVNVTATVDGAASSWTIGQTLFVGDDSVGPGTMVLTDAGRVSAGAVSVGEDSILRIGAGGRSGTLSTRSVANAGAIVFNHSDDVIFGAPISGPGTLTKQGVGGLTLEGASTYTGPTLVQAGRLNVTGSLASAVTIASGASLTGTGAIGGLAVQTGATVAPGNVMDPLNVHGNVLFYAGSIFTIAATPAGQADRIDADGTANLQGGTLQVVSGQGIYRPSTVYTILTAKGGVTGRFSNTTDTLAFLTPSLTYGSNSVTLSLTRAVIPPTPINPVQPIAFHSVATTRNQYSTADGIEGLGEGNLLFDTVLSQTTSGAREAFDALSGEMHASTVTSAFGDARLVQDAVLGHLSRPARSGFSVGQGTITADYAADRPGAAPQPMPIPTFDTTRFSLWGEGLGAWGRTRSNDNAASLDTSTGGFILGAETKLDPAYRLGIAGGYIRTSSDIHARLSEATNDSIFGAVYGTAEWNSLALRLGASYARHDVDTRRNVVFPLFSDTTTAAYDGSTVQAFSEIGYRVGWDNGRIEPFLGASILRLHTNGFQENGGAAALTGYEAGYNLGTTTLGLRAEARLGADAAVTLNGMLGWRRAFGDTDPKALLAFAGGASAFTVSGIPIDQNALVAEAGLDWQVTRTMSLGAAYSGQIGSRSQEHAVKGNFILRF